MKISLALTLTIGRDKPDDLTVDLVGTHHDIPPASYGAGFTQPD